MIEGLRVLPWWHEAARRSLLGDKSNCETCMTRQSPHARQLGGCGYEPLLETREPWSGGSLPNYSGPQTTVCPGFSIALPEVIEVARARLHWSKGSLDQFCHGQAHDALIEGIEYLDGAVSEFQFWSSTPADKGGGGR